MDVDNPWQVESIEAFYCLKCPECTFYTKEEEIFFYHAFENHTLSNVFFGKSAKGKEFLAQKGILNEDVNFRMKQTKNCDPELLLRETKNLKEKEIETEIMIQRHIAIMELPVDCSKSKYELLKELHKIGDVKNRELPKRKKRYPKSTGAPKHPLSSYTHFPRREGVREDSPDMSSKETEEEELSKTFKCDFEGCEKSYDTKNGLNKHKSNVHKPRKKCNDCGEKYFTSNKSQHLKFCGRPRTKCTHCGVDMTRWKKSTRHKTKTDCTKKKKTTQKKKRNKKKYKMGT